MNKLYIAKITDNNDKEKLGRVQVYIDSFMGGYDPEHYNWAYPASVIGGGGSSDFGVSDIPETGSKVYVYFEDDGYKKNAFYLSDVHLAKLNPHKLFDEKIKSNIDGWESEYPDVKFRAYANGICTSVSSNLDTPEIAIYHPKGARVFIDKSGKIHMKNNEADLKEILTDIHSLLVNILTMTNWAGNMGSPLVYNSPADISDTLPGLMEQINNLME